MVRRPAPTTSPTRRAAGSRRPTGGGCSTWSASGATPYWHADVIDAANAARRQAEGERLRLQAGIPERHPDEPTSTCFTTSSITRGANCQSSRTPPPEAAAFRGRQSRLGLPRSPTTSTASPRACFEAGVADPCDARAALLPANSSKWGERTRRARRAATRAILPGPAARGSSPTSGPTPFLSSDGPPRPAPARTSGCARTAGKEAAVRLVTEMDGVELREPRFEVAARAHASTRTMRQPARSRAARRLALRQPGHRRRVHQGGGAGRAS